MKKDDYCNELMKAKTLGYPVDQEALNACKK